MARTLYRTEKDKMIGGVCGGLGKYFDIDPTIVRLFFALIFFGYGSGAMIYVLLLIIMPSELMLKTQNTAKENQPESSESAEDIDEVVVTPNDVIDAG